MPLLRRQATPNCKPPTPDLEPQKHTKITAKTPRALSSLSHCFILLKRVPRAWLRLWSVFRDFQMSRNISYQTRAKSISFPHAIALPRPKGGLQDQPNIQNQSAQRDVAGIPCDEARGVTHIYSRNLGKT